MSRQNFYKTKKLRQRKLVDEDLIVELIKRERRIHPNIGARKTLRLIRPYLCMLGISVGRDRLFEIFRNKGLSNRRRRRGCRTTNSYHKFRVYPNLLKDLEVTGPNQAWVSDITYLRTVNGFVYLALIMDAYSRKIVGYDLGDSLEATGCVRALRMALRQKPEGSKLIHHSDRGCQYCCNMYIELLKDHDIEVSMTEINHCYENAMAERLNGILKHEYGLKDRFTNKKEAHVSVKQAVTIYNDFRPHLSLDYQTPTQVHGEAA